MHDRERLAELHGDRHRVQWIEHVSSRPDLVQPLAQGRTARVGANDVERVELVVGPDRDQRQANEPVGRQQVGVGELAGLDDPMREQVAELSLHHDLGGDHGQQQQPLALASPEARAMRDLAEVFEHDDRRTRLLAGHAKILGIDDGPRGEHGAPA
ncbi:hypothetical protein ACNOYE_37670 [Nannocystaceae bacterium ST9]